MPELPEVETTALGLSKTILNRKIARFYSDTPQVLQHLALSRRIGEFLKGDSVTSIGRHGKYILFYLKSGRVLISHMKMTGRFLATNNKSPITNNEYVRFGVDFSDGTKLLFYDVRKFGRLWLIPQEKLPSFFGDRKLAHDAISSLCTPAYLATQLKRNRPIKVLLLDQTRIAGIGNIYADELLWEAKVNPKRKGVSLSRDECSRIYKAMQKVLAAGIKAGGTSIRDFKQPDGSLGYFQTKRKVYQRAGMACFRCGTKIKRMIIGQRASHFCSQCQK